MNLELYFAPGACSFVAHFALEAIHSATGQAFEPKMLKLHKGEQKAPEFLALNPNGQVPLLIVDGKPLTQIVAICDFLDRAFPAAKLLPAEPLARAHAMSTFAWMNNSAHPAFTHFFMPSKFTADEAAQAAIKAQATEDFQGHVRRVERLATQTGTRFFGGDAPNLLDAYALTLFRWSGWTGLNPADIPALRDLVHAMTETPDMKNVIARERLTFDTYKAA